MTTPAYQQYSDFIILSESPCNAGLSSLLFFQGFHIYLKRFHFFKKIRIFRVFLKNIQNEYVLEITNDFLLSDSVSIEHKLGAGGGDIFNLSFFSINFLVNGYYLYISSVLTFLITYLQYVTVATLIIVSLNSVQ